jgi:hypothetical protein
MGLFDKLRRGDNTEEVELKPAQHAGVNRTRRRVNNPDTSSRRDTDENEEVELEDMWNKERRRAGSDRSRSSGRNANTGRRSSEQASEDDDSDDFILPGMKTVADEKDDEDEREPDRTPDRPDDKLDQLLDQNERIITLLEDIADMTDDETDATDAATDTGMW